MQKNNYTSQIEKGCKRFHKKNKHFHLSFLSNLAGFSTDEASIKPLNRDRSNYLESFVVLFFFFFLELKNQLQLFNFLIFHVYHFVSPDEYIWWLWPRKLWGQSSRNAWTRTYGRTSPIRSTCSSWSPRSLW